MGFDGNCEKTLKRRKKKKKSMGSFSLLFLVIITAGAAVVRQNEELIRSYFTGSTYGGEPFRVRNVTAEEFRRLVVKGEPFIVEDGLRGWPGFGTWSCTYLRDTFPDEVVDAQPYHVGVESRRTMREIFIAGMDAPVPDASEDKKSSRIVSWFTPFGIGRTNATARRMIEEGAPFPYFIPDTERNRKAYYGRMEFFFGLQGSGLHPHTDPQCQYVASAQLSGRKVWRLGMPLGASRQKDVDLSSVDNLVKMQEKGMMQLGAMREVELKPGDVLIFPPGTVHATTVQREGDCSVSMSVQFESPFPASYVKTMHEELSSDFLNTGRCFLESHNMWLFGAGLPNTNGDAQSNVLYVQLIFGMMDRDGSEQVNYTEALEHFKGDFEVAEAFFDANDANRDGLVGMWELQATVSSIWTPTVAKRAIQAIHFTSIDMNADDVLTQDEYEAAFPGRPWANVLAALDDNEDGIVRVHEFRRHIDGAIDLTGEDGPSKHFDVIVDVNNNNQEEEEKEPEGFPWKMIVKFDGNENCDYLGPSNGTGFAFLVFHDTGDIWMGNFENFQRSSGCSVRCCSTGAPVYEIHPSSSESVDRCSTLFTIDSTPDDDTLFSTPSQVPRPGLLVSVDGHFHISLFNGYKAVGDGLMVFQRRSKIVRMN